jgi:hypothetical protein
MPRPRPPPRHPTPTLRLLSKTGNRWPGAVADYDESTAKWLVDRGLAEYVTDDNSSAPSPATRQ